VTASSSGESVLAGDQSVAPDRPVPLPGSPRSKVQDRRRIWAVMGWSTDVFRTVLVATYSWFRVPC